VTGTVHGTKKAAGDQEKDVEASDEESQPPVRDDSGRPEDDICKMIVGFLPGISNSFGGAANDIPHIARRICLSFAPAAAVTYDHALSLFIYRYMNNLAVFYRRDRLNGRLDYNRRCRRQPRFDAFNPCNNGSVDLMGRLDASMDADMASNSSRRWGQAVFPKTAITASGRSMTCRRTSAISRAPTAFRFARDFDARTPQRLLRPRLQGEMC
jgi:hypothetical protein